MSTPPTANAQQELPPEPPLYQFGRMPCRIFTTLWFDFKVYGAQHVPRRGGVLIVSNHQSNLDPVLLGVQNPRTLSYLAKSSLFTNRAFGWMIRNLNAYPVRLGEGDVGAVKETIRRLQEGHALNIFPEGSRSVDGEIGPLQAGSALIIRRAGVPVVPAVIDGSFDAMPRGSTGIRRVPIRVQFGRPMQLHEMKAAHITTLLEITLRKMLETLREREPVLQKAKLKRRRRGR
jgi:1-acyl-sn-glycerol-3-phosphate acyltransferase